MRSGFPDLVYEGKQDDPLEIPADGISLDLLQAVYRHPGLALHVRMRAAGLAIPYEVPKLAVTYQASEKDFATLLDQRLKRIEQMKLIDARPTNEKVDGNGDVRLPPRVPDRRFRRI